MTGTSDAAQPVSDDYDAGVAALEAAAWGLLSAFSLILGAGIGIARLPNATIRAMLMAFGAGALLEALSIELFGHIIHQQSVVGPEVVWLAIGAGIFGGCFFAALNKVLNEQGAFVRKVSTVKSAARRLRAALQNRLIHRLETVPLFQQWPREDLEQVASLMVQERFRPGETIFRKLDRHSPLYFILKGTVQVSLFTPVEDPKLADLEEGTKEIVDQVILNKGQLFGETALLMGMTVQSEAVAQTAVKLLKINGSEFHSLLAAQPRAQQFVQAMAVERLKETAIFSGVGKRQLARLVNFMVQEEYDRETVLFRKVDAECPLYFIVLGSIEVAYADPPEVRMYRANDLVGTDHLVQKEDVVATATVNERTTVMKISREDFSKLCRQDTRFFDAVTYSCSNAAILSFQSGESRGTDPARPPRVSSGVSVGCTEPVAGTGGGAGGAEPPDVARPEVDVPGVVGVVPADGQEHSSDVPMVRRNLSAGKPVRLASIGRRPSCDGVGLLTRTATITEALPGYKSLAEHGWNPMGTPVGGSPKTAWVQSNAPAVTIARNITSTADPCDALNDKMIEHVGDDEIIQDEISNLHNHHGGKTAAIMIWLGILIDGIPESFVLGILSNGADNSSLLTFVIGVFLANFPEAMSSSGTMKACGVKTVTILAMWGTIFVGTGFGAALGALTFPPGSGEKRSSILIQVGIEGLCGGAMLTMIANTALPEAFEQGGNVVGLSCLMGFMSAIAVKSLSMG